MSWNKAVKLERNFNQGGESLPRSYPCLSKTSLIISKDTLPGIVSVQNKFLPVIANLCSSRSFSPICSRCSKPFPFPMSFPTNLELPIRNLCTLFAFNWRNDCLEWNTSYIPILRKIQYIITASEDILSLKMKWIPAVLWVLSSFVIKNTELGPIQQGWLPRRV